jgi:hypothetical protein
MEHQESKDIQEFVEDTVLLKNFLCTLCRTPKKSIQAQMQESRGQTFSCTEFWSEKDSRGLQEWKAFPYATLTEQTEAARAGPAECILRHAFHFETRFDEEVG